MELDPKAKALLTAIAAAGDPPINEMPLEKARQVIESGYARMNMPVTPVNSITNLVIPGPGGELNIRVYIPDGDGTFPLMLFFHGGGWVLFTLDAYDSMCTHLCSMAPCVVVSVDYRRSPEFRFPAATDDCMAATLWAVSNAMKFRGDPGKLFLAGDSAGGNLAAVTALRLRDEGGPAVKGQILIYPVTDYLEPEKQSYVTFAEGYSLTREAMKWFWAQYLENPGDAVNPYVAPLQATNLFLLPDALVMVSGYDPLRDEGIAYAKRLSESGVSVKLTVYEEMIHGFISYLGILPQALKAIHEIAGWMRSFS